MAFMLWSDRLSVGVPSLDRDHKKLVEMINTLSDAMQTGHSKHAVGEILDQLVAYTAEHFHREEEYFARTSYPDTAAHKSQHDAFKRKVQAEREKFASGATLTLSIEVLNLLRDWITQHILGSDQKYSRRLAGHGIR